MTTHRSRQIVSLDKHGHKKISSIFFLYSLAVLFWEKLCRPSDSLFSNVRRWSLDASCAKNANTFRPSLSKHCNSLIDDMSWLHPFGPALTGVESVTCIHSRRASSPQQVYHRCMCARYRDTVNLFQVCTPTDSQSYFSNLKLPPHSFLSSIDAPNTEF